MTTTNLTDRRTASLDAEWARLSSQADAAGVDVEDLLAIQTLPTNVLRAAAVGRLDLNALARAGMADRGLDHDGRWVGFPQAKKIWANARENA